MIQQMIMRLLSIIILLQFISNPKINCQKHSISLNPNITKVSSPLSGIIKDLRVVHLESSQNAFIGHFSYLVYLDMNYIVYVSDKSVIVFDGKGKYLSKIDALGRGPEEYSTISNAFVDAPNKTVYIVDYNDIKLFGFDGRYHKTLKIPSSSGGVFRKSNGDLIVVCSQIYNKEKRDMLYLLDASQKIHHTFYSRNPDVCKDLQQNLFFAGTPYELNGKLFYSEPFVDTIFEISDTNLIPHWSISAGKLKFKTEDGINTSNFAKASNKILPALFETQDFFFFQYSYDHKEYRSVFDKEKNSFIFHQEFDSKNNIGLKNDIIDGYPMFWPKYINGRTLVCPISPATLNQDQLMNLKCNLDDNIILLVGTAK